MKDSNLNNLYPSLTLVGVGPGDPSLLTLAAVEAIKSADVIAYPVSTKGGISIAATIADGFISLEQKHLPLLFPMVNDIDICKSAWKEAGNKLSENIADGNQVAFLCQGDVSLYASSAYVLFDIRANHPECSVKLIPGVTAFAAAAAAGQWPLVLQQQQLLVMPAPDELDHLEDVINEVNSLGRVLILLKLGRRWGWIKPYLEQKGLLEYTLFCQRVGFFDEQIKLAKDVPADDKPYFSLLIIRKDYPQLISTYTSL